MVADYLRQQEIPMVIVSHDREFLDQLCTKIVETELGVSHTYKGNYTQYIASKAERSAQQYSAYEKQQKEIARLVRLIVTVLAEGVVHVGLLIALRCRWTGWLMWRTFAYNASASKAALIKEP